MEVKPHMSENDLIIWYYDQCAKLNLRHQSVNFPILVFIWKVFRFRACPRASANTCDWMGAWDNQ